MRAVPLTLLLSLSAMPLLAQGNCFPSKSSNEADLFAHFSVPLAFSPAQSPWAEQPGTIQIGVEAALIPDASDEIATPTTCRPGKGPENVNILPGLVRPRLAIGLTDGIVLEMSWTPPIRVSGVKANLWSFAVSRTVPINPNGGTFFGRLHATFGSLHAPFTCPDKALQDPLSECFQGTRSDDRYSPNIYGVELGFGFPMAHGALRPYLGGGYNILHPRFQVNFTNAADSTDRRKVEVNLHRWVVFGGVTVAATPNLSLSGELYSAPSDLITARARVSLKFGGRARR
ncbi:MAG: hypothetical protein ABI587_16560 [Gemmatimonadales bacterium]